LAWILTIGIGIAIAIGFVTPDITTGIAMILGLPEPMIMGHAIALRPNVAKKKKTG